jgi:hypothetical protein
VASLDNLYRFSATSTLSEAQAEVREESLDALAGLHRWPIRFRVTGFGMISHEIRCVLKRTSTHREPCSRRGS